MGAIRNTNQKVGKGYEEAAYWLELEKRKAAGEKKKGGGKAK